MFRLPDGAWLAGGVALAIVGVLWWTKNRVAAVVDSGALNPADPDNLINQAINGTIERQTGVPGQTLMGWVDDVLGVNQGLAPGEYSEGGVIRRAPLPAVFVSPVELVGEKVY